MNSQLGICIYGVGTEYVKENGIKRVQICHKFSDTEKVTSLLKLTRSDDIGISYHAPVFHQVDPKSTYYLSKNFRLREATFEILEINLKMASSLPSDYAVIHFTSETMKRESYDSKEEIMKIAKRSTKRLQMLAEKYNTDVNLEYASYANILREPTDWIEIVRDHSRVGLCLDIGQLYRNSMIDGYDFYRKLGEILPYTRVVHIWNTRELKDLEKHGYIPVHPSQRPEDGWIDIKRVLNMVRAENREIPIILEPNFEYGGEKFFSEGLYWVNSIMEEELEVSVVSKKRSNSKLLETAMI